jgi:hypothetical protein
LNPWEAVASIDDRVVDEAWELYRQRFDVGRDSTTKL